MPYRKAHYYLLLLMALTVLAFWPSYFAVISTATTASHFHGFTASLWIALLAFQSWSIHHRRNEWHRAVGLSSLLLFPFFFAGSVLIIHSVAWRYATADNPFASVVGARLAVLDIIATAGIAFLYWSGLRWRRKVHLHARYLLATVFFLFAPIIARLLRLYVPPLQVTPPEFANLTLNVELASFATLVFALGLAWKQPKHAKPWLITAAIVALQMVLFVTLGVFGPWEALVRAIGALPASLLFSAGLAAGIVVSWLGWSAVPPRLVLRDLPAEGGAIR